MKKKLIFSFVAGWGLSNLIHMYADGVLDRGSELIKRANQGESLPEMGPILEYMFEGTGPYNPKTMKEARIEEMREEGEKREARARAMSAEGFSHQEIADSLGIRENHVQALLMPIGPRYFRVTLSEEQHEAIEIALRNISESDSRRFAEDDERTMRAYERVDETLTAFRETTEEVE